jgi:hypothetical protein
MVFWLLIDHNRGLEGEATLTPLTLITVDRPSSPSQAGRVVIINDNQTNKAETDPAHR